MNTKPTRKFTLLDMMILTAATAIGMALMELFHRRLFSTLPDPVAWHRHAAVVVRGVEISWYFLTAWGPALLFCRFVPPRPRLRKVLSQPGTVACYAMTLPLFVQATSFVFLISKEKHEMIHARAHVLHMNGFLYESYFMDKVNAGLVVFSIVGAWLTLALTGRWRPERDWVDRAGRFVGFAWIVGYAMSRGWLVFERLRLP